MQKGNRVPSVIAIIWGVIVLVCLPTASRLESPGGINEHWTAMMICLGVQAILCTWASRTVRHDLWSRFLLIVGIAMVLDTGIDLGQVYFVQEKYDRMHMGTVPDMREIAVDVHHQ